MKEINTITIAMMKDPTTPTWLAQIHVEYQDTKMKEVLPLRGDSGPLSLLARCRNALETKFKEVNGSIVKK